MFFFLYLQIPASFKHGPLFFWNDLTPIFAIFGRKNKATELKAKWTECLCNVWKVYRTIAPASLRSPLMCFSAASLLDAAGWRLLISSYPRRALGGVGGVVCEQKLLTRRSGCGYKGGASQLIKGPRAWWVRRCLMNVQPNRHRLSHLLWRRPSQR